MKTIAILIPVLTLLLAHRTELRAADVAAKTATDSLDPAAPTAASRYAVDRSGQRPVPVFTAPGHCAWPNLKLLSDGRTLAALIFNDASHGHHPGDIECWLSADGGATWREPVRLVDWNGLDGGYPSSVQRADGQVVTAYYCSAVPADPPNSYQNYHMAVIVWDPEQTFAKE